MLKDEIKIKKQLKKLIRLSHQTYYSSHKIVITWLKGNRKKSSTLFLKWKTSKNKKKLKKKYQLMLIF